MFTYAPMLSRPKGPWKGEEAMESLERLLAENPMFEDLDPETMQTIVGCVSNVRFDAGQFIIKEGEEAQRFYVIREGTVAVEVFHLERGAIPLQHLEAGDVLGWSWLVAPYKWRFDARAVTRVRAFAFDGACLRNKCNEDPRLGFELLKRFARVLESRLQATRRQLVEAHIRMV
jgi:CRP-like cAMP-binding protein